MTKESARLQSDRKRASRLIRPGPLVVAAGILWAAANEPTSFTPSSAAVWLLGGLTAALLARAALALLQPLVKLGMGALLNGMPRRARNVASSDQP